MSILYGNVPYNREILLDLPFREAAGIVTQDMAKPHHPMVMANTPDWATLDSGLGVLDLNGANEYLYCLAASCLDLDFTGDYSLCGWIKWETGDDSQIVIGRYGIDTGAGSCIYTCPGCSLSGTTMQRGLHLEQPHTVQDGQRACGTSLVLAEQPEPYRWTCTATLRPR